MLKAPAWCKMGFNKVKFGDSGFGKMVIGKLGAKDDVVQLTTLKVKNC